MHIVTRLGQAVLSLLAASLLVWAMMAAAPGDPALRVLHARGILEPDPAQVAATRTELGLDRPVALRYMSWLGDAARGDLGPSWTTGKPVATEFFTRLPATAILTVAAMTLALALTLALGIPSALFANRLPDRVCRLISLGLLSLPGFVLGVAILDVVTLRLGLGRVLADGTWGTVLLPALTLAVASAASWGRILRASLLETSSAAFLDVARARGASGRYGLTRHLLPHAAPALLTVLALGTAAMLGGAPIVETVFSWPGVGRYAVQAIEGRDLPVVAGFTMLAVTTYVVVSLTTDLAHRWIDPRLRTR